MTARRWMTIAVVLALAGCGGGSGESSEGEVLNQATPAPTPPTGATTYSLAVDPADGTMFLTVGPFTHRLAPGASEFVQLEPEMTAGDARGPLKDLVMRFTGPGQMLASGHALRPPLPQNVGLVTSTDGAATWTSLSGFDEADYHEVEVTSDQVVGLRSDSRGVRVSRDGGKNFETREPPGDTPPIDAATNPADPDVIAVSSAQGVFISTNGGGSWRQRDATSTTRLAWPKEDALYSAGLDGQIRVSSDSGRSWEKTGTLGTGPKEFTFSPEGTLLVVMADGEIRESSDGGATWEAVAKLQL